VLVSRNGRLDSLTIRARVIDPAEGLDRNAAVTVDDGVITENDDVETAPEGLLLPPA
jgi:predicted amidohydrolase